MSLPKNSVLTHTLVWIGLVVGLVWLVSQAEFYHWSGDREGFNCGFVLFERRFEVRQVQLEGLGNVRHQTTIQFGTSAREWFLQTIFGGDGHAPFKFGSTKQVITYLGPAWHLIPVPILLVVGMGWLALVLRKPLARTFRGTR